MQQLLVLHHFPPPPREGAFGHPKKVGAPIAVNVSMKILNVTSVLCFLQGVRVGGGMRMCVCVCVCDTCANVYVGCGDLVWHMACTQVIAFDLNINRVDLGHDH